MNKVQSLEGMILLYAPEQVYAALLASVPLDCHAFINNLQFLSVGGDFNLVDRNDGDDSEDGARGLPAFGAAAGVVMEDIAAEIHFNFVVGAVATELTAGEAVAAFCDAVIEKGVK